MTIGKMCTRTEISLRGNFSARFKTLEMIMMEVLVRSLQERERERVFLCCVICHLRIYSLASERKVNIHVIRCCISSSPYFYFMFVFIGKCRVFLFVVHSLFAEQAIEHTSMRGGLKKEVRI